MLKQNITTILKTYPQARNSDNYLRMIYYWNFHNEECKEIDNKLFISADAMNKVDPESIRRTRQKIQEEAKRLFLDGKEQYAELLADDQVKKVRDEKAKQVAKSFGNNIDSVL